MSVFAPDFPPERLTFSQTAERRGIDNDVPQELIPNLVRLSWFLDAIEEIVQQAWPGTRVEVTSGYRCPELNRAVGGAASSAHTKALAADIKVPGVSPHALASVLAEELEGFDQIIQEFTWVHVALPASAGAGREQLLTAVKTPDGISYRTGLA